MNDQSNKQYLRIGRGMIYVAWALIFALLIWFFGIVETNKKNPNQNVVTTLSDIGTKEVILKSSNYGHYVVTGEINNQKVTFMVDTGASFVSIPERIAKKLHLEQGAPMRVTTANGEVTVYATTLDSVGIGDIKLHNIKANINPYMRGEEILLGMSFLRHLSVTHKNNQLTIHQ